MTIQPSFPISCVGVAHQIVRMSCVTACRLDDVVIAYVSGIKVGESYVRGVFRAGQVIEFPIQYLPFVDLPIDIRFVRSRDGAEVASPFTLKTLEDAVMLVGIGEIQIESLSIERGVVRGVAVNRVNGLFRPQMFARINGVVPRAVTVDQHRLLDDGGASFQLTARLEPQDLTESGLSVEIFVVGKDAPLSSIVYRRADPEDVLKRLTHLESRLDQGQQATGYQIQQLDNEVNARIGLLQDRMDAFIEYAASMLFDRGAAERVHEVAGAPALAPETRRKVEQLLELVRSGGKTKIQALSDRTSRLQKIVAPLRSSMFSQGWYDPEVDDGDEYRWMSSEGIVFNPAPQRQLSEVRIDIVGVYGAELPILRCFFDGVPAVVLRDHAKAEGPLKLSIRPPEDQPLVTCEILRIESVVSASPATLEGLTDQRLLSIAVSQMTFLYAK